MPGTQTTLVSEVIRKIGADRTRVLDIAREVQRRIGYVDAESVKEIAGALGLKPVEVRDALSFYSFISLSPSGKAALRLSTCEAGRLRGSEEVARTLEKEAGVGFGETTPDGAISLLRTSCTGMCDQSPAALVDGGVLTNISPKDAGSIVKALREGTAARGSPQAAPAALMSSKRVESNLRQAGPVIFAPMERGAAIRSALNKSPDQVIEEIVKSRLRGRGGAGFPTGMKWGLCRKAPGSEHHILCNADEGEPGTFKDRVILTEVPDLVFEGMTIGGYCLGARVGTLYLRGEYAYLRERLEGVLERRRRLGLLGNAVCGREGFDFDIEIRLGAGAYICGEESSLIESMEGKRGAPRDRPPYPVQRGFMGQPTSVNNVETLCAAARILEKGAEWFSGMGTRDSTGTKVLSVSGDCERPGVYEVELGIVIDRLLEGRSQDRPRFHGVFRGGILRVVRPMPDRHLPAP
jgi:[NiFe] hydrogenase diaphorase moiety large subunit